jgi:hypothetical protein
MPSIKSRLPIRTGFGTALVVPFLVLTLVFTACDEPVAPDVSEEFPAYDIWDALHEGDGLGLGNPHFFFLHPIGHPRPRKDFNGTFDPNLDPVIEICEWEAGACVGDLLARFTTGSGEISENIQVFPLLQWYSVWWRTNGLGLEQGKIYRIRVLVAGTELGYADVDVVKGLRDVIKYKEFDDFVPLRQDGVLPIRFRIEQGAVFVLGPAGGTVATQDGGVVLVIASGGLDEDVGITVTKLVDFPSGAGLIDDAVFDFQPDGLEFAEPGELTIRYDPTKLPPGVDEATLTLLTEVGSLWEEIPGSVVDVAANTVTALVTRFSTKAVGQSADSIALLPGSANLVVTDTVRIVAIVMDSSGTVLTNRHHRGRGGLHWSRDCDQSRQRIRDRDVRRGQFGCLRLRRKSSAGAFGVVA